MWRDDPPELVYHYTDGGGVRGVIANQVFWATDVRYMNDEAELKVALSLLDETFKQGLAGLPDGEAKDWMASLGSQLERFETMALFAVCFCGNGNLLSMWNRYGAQTGYSIGFEAKPLNVLSMIYDVAEQRDAIIDGVRWFYANFGKDFAKFAHDPNARDAVALELVTIVAIRMARIKHKAFSDEEEYRRIKFVSLRKDLGDIKFRARGVLGFAPYVELDRGGLGLKDRLPIRKIYVGPTMHAELATHGLRLLLDQNGYDDVVIEKSAIPYRASTFSAT